MYLDQECTNCLPWLADEKHQQNGVFYATLIKDESQAMKMIDYLVSLGVKAATTDHLS